MSRVSQTILTEDHRMLPPGKSQKSKELSFSCALTSLCGKDRVNVIAAGRLATPSYLRVVVSIRSTSAGKTIQR
jgi:hypothetical protein